MYTQEEKERGGRTREKIESQASQQHCPTNNVQPVYLEEGEKG